MRRIIGYTIFFIGIGMIVAIIFPYRLIRILIAGALLLLGYNLFCCK